MYMRVCVCVYTKYARKNAVEKKSCLPMERVFIILRLQVRYTYQLGLV